MMKYRQTFHLGTATISVINVGDGQVNLADMLNVPVTEWSPRYATFFEQPLRAPFQCVHIGLSDRSILVDASSYPSLDSPYGKFAIPGYQPPPDLLAQLAEMGVRPEQITHVIFTHWHWDHHSGVTMERDGHYIPCFPKARHYLGRADWESTDTQKALKDPNAIENHTLAVLHRQGLLDLVEGNRDLGAGIQMLAAPGESPGHQIVRVHSQGQTLYGLGDLYHHPVEVEQPAWSTHWADAPASLASRQSLSESALAERAFLIAAHIPGVGRLERTTTGMRWNTI